VPHGGGGRWEFTSVPPEWGCCCRLEGNEIGDPAAFASAANGGGGQKGLVGKGKRDDDKGHRGREITKRPLEASTTCCCATVAFPFCRFVFSLGAFFLSTAIFAYSKVSADGSMNSSNADRSAS